MDSPGTVELIVEGVTGRRALTADETAYVKHIVSKHHRLMRGVVVFMGALIGGVILLSIFLANKDPGAAFIFFLICVPVLTLLAFYSHRQSSYVPADYALIRIARCNVLFDEHTSRRRRRPVYFVGTRQVTIAPGLALRWPKDKMVLAMACPVFGGGHPFPDVVLSLYTVSENDSGAVVDASAALFTLHPELGPTH